MKSSKLLLFAVMFALSFSFACGPDADNQGEVETVPPVEEAAPEATPSPTAHAILRGAEGEIVGVVTLTGGMAGVQVTGDLAAGSDAGSHGFHIHESGECVAPDFTSAGGHFNPAGVPHACPPTTPRHAGDFGNVTFVGGSGRVDASSDLITLAPGETNSVLGKAIILHAGEDDCVTQPTGDAGGRLACGVVEMGAAPAGAAPGTAAPAAAADEAQH